MASIKQKKAFVKSMENNGNVSKAMREAGYSPNTAKTPKALTESKGWKELMEEYLPEKDLAKAHNDLLNAGSIERFGFNRDIPDEDIIEAMSGVNGCKVLYIRHHKREDSVAYIKVADYLARKNALDMAYKLRGSYAAEKVDTTVKVDVENKEKVKNAIKGIVS